MENKVDSLDGTQAEELIMIFENQIFTETDFIQQIDLFPKRIAKKGFIPTHKVTWIYKKTWSRLSGGFYTIVRENEIVTPL